MISKKLIDVCEIIMGQSPDSSSYNDEGKGLPFYQGKADFGEVYPIPRKYCDLPSKIAEKNDILMSVRAPVGDVNISTETCCIGRGVSALRAREDINYKYLYYVLNSMKERIANLGTGSTFKAINKKQLENIEIPVPPLKTQLQIVEALDVVKQIISNRQSQIAALDELTQSLFFEMFGDLKRNHNKCLISTLGEICPIIKDGPHVSPNYTNEGIPFISVNNIIKGKWDFSSVKYISREDYEKFAKRCKPELGDVLYTKGGTTGFAKYVDIDTEFINWVHIAVLKYNKTIIDGIFLTYMLNSSFCYRQSQLYTRGIANRDLVLGQMKKIKVLVPPLQKQKEFAEIVIELEKNKALLERGLEEHNILFQSLLQKAFKGELFKE